MKTSKARRKAVKHQVCSIYLHRSEGPRDELGSVHLPACDYPDGGVWAAASATLRAWARSAPDLDHAPTDGEGDRVAFEVVFSNGAVYKGAYALSRRDVEDGELRQCCLYLIHFYAGLCRPAGVSDEDYDRYLAERDDDCAAAHLMLEEYDFGADLVPPVGLAVKIGGLTDVEHGD